MLDCGKPRFSFHGEEKLFAQAKEQLGKFAENLKCVSSSGVPQTLPGSQESNKSFFPLPMGVNFGVVALPGTPLLHPDGPKLDVLSSLVSLQYLHPLIREKGGAYGAGLRSGRALRFFTYRDPNLESSLETIRNTPRWIADSSNYAESKIDEAKLHTFQKLDSPIIPSQRGLSYFRQYYTPAMRQKYREGVFNTSRADLLRLAEQYFDFDSSSSVAVLGNEQLTESLDSSWEVLKLQ